MSTNQKTIQANWKISELRWSLSKGKLLGKCLPGKFIEAIHQTINYLQPKENPHQTQNATCQFQSEIPKLIRLETLRKKEGIWQF